MDINLLVETLIYVFILFLCICAINLSNKEDIEYKKLHGYYPIYIHLTILFIKCILWGILAGYSFFNLIKLYL